MEQFPKLLSPIKLGGLELKNRFVVSPMASELCDTDGLVNQAIIDFWVARAKGGWGLLIEGFAAVDLLGKATPHQIAIWDDKAIDGLTRLSDAVHKYGARISIQLAHAGRQTTSKFTGAQPVAPSPVPCPLCKEIPHELSEDEIDGLIEKFGDAALRAQEAGFDSVEVHGGHGYLLAQFMSAYTNKRTDCFGGKFENRMRFPVEVIKNIRRKVRSRFPITFRLSADEMVPGGRTLTESCMVARVVEEAGVDAINVSISVYGSAQYVVAPAAMSPGYLLPYAAEIKKSVAVPVIVAGRINEPLLAEYAIETGKADLIGFGRTSLADPELPNKVALGNLDEICPCIYCMIGCMFTPSKASPIKKSVLCTVNPFCSREGELKIKLAVKSKKVIVVGGGPGGLEAAWVAAACGHRVTLYEKEQTLGGQFRIAAIPPLKQDITKSICYYTRMCEKYGVSIKLGIEATDKQIMAEKPDVVIVATGGKPLIPDIKGVDGERVVSAWEVIQGKRQTGAKVLIIGGGSVGCETADLLGEGLHKVTIVEMLSKIATDVNAAQRYFLFQRLAEYKVKIETGAKVKEFLQDGVVVEKGGKEIRMTGYDSIVLSMGVKPVNTLKAKLEGKVPELYIIGDALEPRQAIDAIREGASIASKL